MSLHAPELPGARRSVEVHCSERSIDGTFLLPELGQNDRIVAQPLFALGQPARCVGQRNTLQLAQKRGEEVFGVRLDGNLDGHFEFANLMGIDVDEDFSGSTGEVLVAEGHLGHV